MVKNEKQITNPKFIEGKCELALCKSNYSTVTEVTQRLTSTNNKLKVWRICIPCFHIFGSKLPDNKVIKKRLEKENMFYSKPNPKSEIIGGFRI